MRPARCLSFAVVALTLFVCAILPAAAATTTYTGTFAADNTVLQFNVVSASTQVYTFSTSSYGTGGFVPVLSLFTSTGKIVGSDGADGVCNGTAVKSASTGMCDDAFFTQTLNAGSYILALTEFPVSAIGNLSDGFFFSNDPNATGTFCGVTNGKFLQADNAACTQRTAAYTVNINSASPVPEPSTWALMLPAVAGLFFLNQRRQQQA